jgi:hypothetical protein
MESSSTSSSARSRIASARPCATFAPPQRPSDLKATFCSKAAAAATTAAAADPLAGAGASDAMFVKR